jgi:hypothetical protein
VAEDCCAGGGIDILDTRDSTLREARASLCTAPASSSGRLLDGKTIPQKRFQHAVVGLEQLQEAITKPPGNLRVAI